MKQTIFGNPPSKSNCYKIITLGGHGSLAKTPVLKKYENDFFIQHNDVNDSFLRKAVSYKWFEKNVKAKATTQNYLHDFYTLNGYSPYPMVKKTLQEEMQDPANALKGFRE